MYKNLNCNLLGITGRQSEIIELALTYGFRGIDLDIDDLVKRSKRTSFESAAKFLYSSKLTISGFDAPIDLDSDEESYAAQLAQLNGVAEIGQRIGAKHATLTVPAATDRLPYPEYFEAIRKRISQVCQVLEKAELKLALTFSPQAASSEDKQFKFIRDVEGFLALLRACSSSNVGIILDSWIWHLGGGTSEQLDTIPQDRILGVQLGDCKEGVEPAAATEDDCLLPGSTGVINNASLLQRFATLELDVPVSARGKLDDQEPSTRDALISKTQDLLDGLFEEAGIPITTRKPEMFADSGFTRS